MTQPVDALAARIKQLEERLNQLARSPQLHRSSIENGALREYDAGGQLVGQYGRQWDGTHGAVVLAGPTPPVPAGLTAEPVMGGIRYTWDGSWEPGAVAPMDFARAEVELSHDADFTSLLPSGRLTSAAGGQWVHVDLAGTPVYGRLRARSLAGKLSDPGETVGPVAALPVDTTDIREGAITAELLAAVIVLANVLITGNPDADHARLDAGLRIMALNPDGQLVEATTMGTGAADRLSILDPATGQTLLTVNDAGITAPAISTEALTVGGNNLDYLLGQRAGRCLATGVSNAPTPSTSTSRGYFDVEFLAVPGRRYRLHSSTLNLTTSTTATYGFAQLRARPSAEGAPTVATGTAIVTANGSTNLVGGVEAVVLDRTVNFDELFTGTAPTVPTLVRVLICYGVNSGGGNAAIFANSTYPIQVDVDDVGPARHPLLNNNDGGGGGTTVQVTTRTARWASTWAANWQSTTTAPRTDQAELIQGYTPYYTPSGSGVGQFGFGDGFDNATGANRGTIATALAGATVNWMRVYIYNVHWNDYDGGTALLGAHPYLSPPGSRPADWQLNLFQSAGWPRAAGRWIDIPPSWWSGFVSGANRGFTLGDLASTAGEYYGRFAGDPTDSRRPVLEINYTKVS